MSLTQRLFGQFFESSRSLGPLRWKVATATFRTLATVRPQSAWIQRDLGRALSGQEEWSQAEAACQQAIQLNPKDSWSHYALAECYVNQNRWPEASQSASQALALNPNDAWMHHLYGRCLTGQERYSAAVAEFKAAVAQNDNFHWFHYHLGEALVKQGEWSAGIASLEKALALDPNFVWTKYYLGLALTGESRFEEAIALYEQAQVECPEEATLFKNYLDYTHHLHQQQQRLNRYCQARKAAARNGDRPLDVLLVTPYPTYPPKLGAITRMFNEAKGLGKQHRLVVASLIFEPKEWEIAAEMEQHCDLSLVALLGDPAPDMENAPKLIRKYSSQRMEKLLTQLQEIDFDIVCFDFIYMAQYRHLFPRTYTVIGEHNIESDLLKRFAALNPNQAEVNKLVQETAAVDAFNDADSETLKLAAYEDEHWPQFDLRTVVSSNDRDELLRRCPGIETWVVNNGIDTQATPLLANTQARKIFFFGTLTYFPNIDGATYFAQEVMPLIWKEEPDMQFCIAGADPPETVLALAQDPRIEVVASPEVMEDVAKDCHISVVPLRVGSGTRIKILHAMAMGLPVVSTSLGCEGLDGVDGEHLLIRDQPQQIADAVLALDRDRPQWDKLRSNGRHLVEDRYDWQAIYADFEDKLFQAWQAQQVEAVAHA